MTLHAQPAGFTFHGVCTALTALMLGTATAAPVVYDNEAVFRGAAGASTTYGFETHAVSEATELPSPLTAAQLDGHFDLGYSGLNSFQVFDIAGAHGVADGSHFVATHSQATAPAYTLTFSNFGGTGAAITAFALTMTDFASHLEQRQGPWTVRYQAGSLSGVLFSTLLAQPEYTVNFMGLTVDDGDAFSSITLSFNDVASGTQMFDEVIYTAAGAVPLPASWLLVLPGLALLRRRRH